MVASKAGSANPDLSGGPNQASRETSRMGADEQGAIPAMMVKMYTAAWCRDCRAAKQFLETHGIAYTEINVDDDPEASDEVVRHVGKRAIPQLVINGEWFQPYRPGRGLLYDELYERFGIVRNGCH